MNSGALIKGSAIIQEIFSSEDNMEKPTTIKITQDCRVIPFGQHETIPTKAGQKVDVSAADARELIALGKAEKGEEVKEEKKPAK